jgi:seryl-tRNA(Sec) selenium transferase
VEVEAAITPQTVAIAYTAYPGSQPSLLEVVSVARQHGLPVVVDAAAQLPPVKTSAGSSRRVLIWLLSAAARPSGDPRVPEFCAGGATWITAAACSS